MKIHLVSELNPKFFESCNQTIAKAGARGLMVGIHSGVRTADEQDRLYALGRTVKNPDGATAEKPLGNIVTNARAWDGWHNYGLAADLVFKNSKNQWFWPADNDARWDILGGIGEHCGLSWGGRWKFKDRPHFQMLGKIQSKEQAKKILFEEGLEKLWSLI